MYAIRSYYACNASGDATRQRSHKGIILYINTAMIAAMPKVPPSAEMPRRQPLPLFSEAVACGFPSPAEDHLEGRLDLNELCIPHPAATFFLRAQGQSMARNNFV